MSSHPSFHHLLTGYAYLSGYSARPTTSPCLPPCWLVIATISFPLPHLPLLAGYSAWLPPSYCYLIAHQVALLAGYITLAITTVFTSLLITVPHHRVPVPPPLSHLLQCKAVNVSPYFSLTMSPYLFFTVPPLPLSCCFQHKRYSAMIQCKAIATVSISSLLARVQGHHHCVPPPTHTHLSLAGYSSRLPLPYLPTYCLVLAGCSMGLLPYLPIFYLLSGYGARLPHWLHCEATTIVTFYHLAGYGYCHIVKASTIVTSYHLILANLAA
ncbi:hypothetical protein BDQ17DRAFT_1438206 [Cyathus striatus]|nr:hypothetical protein BDQ17DRAFT_1438206 [Cyathus striatus]